MEKKEKLIKALNIVINSLKNDTIHYSWESQSSCNCGIVAQAITGKNKEEVQELFNDVSSKLHDINKDIQRTWKNGVKYLCPITGEPTSEIFKELFKNGLSREDIVHLEYMDNPAILERSKIETIEQEKETKRVVDTETSNEILVPHSNFFMRLLGYTEYKTLTTTSYKEIEVTNDVEIEYHTEQENLIKYLQAWVSILNEGSRGEGLDNTSEIDLEHELLIAVTEEDYDKAILLRDKLNAI